MDMASTNKQMEQSTKVNGKMIFNMAKGKKFVMYLYYV